MLNQLFSNPSSEIWYRILKNFFKRNAWYSNQDIHLLRAESTSPRLVAYILINKYCFRYDSYSPNKSAISWNFSRRYFFKCAHHRMILREALYDIFPTRIEEFRKLPLKIIKSYPYNSDYKINAVMHYLIEDVVKVLGAHVVIGEKKWKSGKYLSYHKREYEKMKKNEEDDL